MVFMNKGWVHFLSTFPPRECGIATFTQDLSSAVQKEFGPAVKSKVCAMNENLLSTYNYPGHVNLQIDEEDRASYLLAAEKLNNMQNTKVVCLQHEFGIFGGTFGDYIIPFLEELKKPCVTTFHSVLPGKPKPDLHRRYVVRKIAEQCSKVVCISGFGKDLLMEQYGVPAEKIAVIPHGIPNIAFNGRKKAKESLGLSGRDVVMTFGLLSKRKGLEHVIRAMPSLVKKYPTILYLIVGETHPVVRRKEGEKYRNKLKKEAMERGLKNHVMFIDKYLSLAQICKCLQAADVYITPYFDLNQISSGTLAYAVGAGRACISTPYLFARDLLRDGRGILVRPKSGAEIAKGIDKILGNPKLKAELEAKSFEFSRNWLWPAIARSYMALFSESLSAKK